MRWLAGSSALHPEHRADGARDLLLGRPEHASPYQAPTRRRSKHSSRLGLRQRFYLAECSAASADRAPLLRQMWRHTCTPSSGSRARAPSPSSTRTSGVLRDAAAQLHRSCDGRTARPLRRVHDVETVCPPTASTSWPPRSKSEIEKVPSASTSISASALLRLLRGGLPDAIRMDTASGILLVQPRGMIYTKETLLASRRGPNGVPTSPVPSRDGSAVTRPLSPSGSSPLAVARVGLSPRNPSTRLFLVHLATWAFFLQMRAEFLAAARSSSTRAIAVLLCSHHGAHPAGRRPPDPLRPALAGRAVAGAVIVLA